MTLREFLAEPHYFSWGGMGGDDCTTFCASWIFESIGIDPAEALRGTYSDAAGAYALLNAAGGLVPFMAGHMEPLGYVRTNDPQDGAIGVIRAPVGFGGDVKEIGAIKFGPLWAALGPAGVRAKKAEFIAAWEVTR